MQEKNSIQLRSQWLTRKEAAAFLRVHPKTIDRLRKQNLLKSYKINGTSCLRFKREDLDALRILE